MKAVRQNQNVALCTIVANSEDCLPRYLAWAIPRFAEIVIVRSPSDDGTDALLDAAAARWPEQIRLSSRPMETIALQKQFCIEQATRRWRLLVDADEVVMHGEWDTIAAHMDRTGVDMVGLPRFNLQADDQHYSTRYYPDIQARFYNERVRFSLKPRFQTHHKMEGARKGLLGDIHMLHWGHIRSEEQLLWKSRVRRRFAENDYFEGAQLKEYDNWFHLRNAELDRDATPLPAGAARYVRRLEAAVAADALFSTVG